jgi:outer membrane murein-binding lipoprotein Lpp
MTPEERFTRIENAIQAVVETQARHEVQLEKQNAGIRDLIVVSRTIIDAQQRADNNMNQLTGTVDQLAGTVDQLAGTVDQLAGTVDGLAGIVNQLISTVDRLANTVDQLSRDVGTLIKSFQKPNGNQ